MTKRFLIFLAAALLVTAGLASATTLGPITTSTPIPLTLTNWSNTLAFQQFNPSLGTLNSVKLDLSGSLSTVITVTSSTYATGWAKTSVDVNVQDVGHNLNSPPISLMSPAFTFTDLNGTVVSGTLTKSGSSSDTYTNAAVLSEFTGTGNILLPADTFTETLVSFTSGNADVSQVTNASLTGTVTYDYTIPEPATIGLLSLGGLTLFRKKKHR
jgi:hypothetical protein